MTIASLQTVAFSSATPADSGLLFRLFAEHRAWMFQAAGMDVAQVDAMLRSQYELRGISYGRSYPAAEQRILVSESGERIGHVLIDWTVPVAHLVDIAVLQSHQRQGIGTAALEQILAEARTLNLPIQLMVDHGSPAERLYTRLGFRVIATNDIQLQMEVSPGGGQA
jgi:GNAT superfamily N-acetyltransferase